VEARDSAVHFEAGALVDGLARIADKPGRRQSHLYASFDWFDLDQIGLD